MNGIGETTRDLQALRETHPAESGLAKADTETRIRRWGTRCLIAGLVIPPVMYGASLVASILAEINVFKSEAAQLFSVLGFIGLMQFATGLLILAGLERLTRPLRALARRSVTRAEDNARIGEELRKEVAINSRLVAELIVTAAASEKRLAGVEQAIEKVPDYGQGLAQGARVAASVLGVDKE